MSPAPDEVSGPRGGRAGDSSAAGERQTAGRPDRGTDPDGPTAAVRDRPLPFAQLVGRVALGLLAVLFVVFAVVNLQPVAFDWIVGRSEPVSQDGNVHGGVPLIVLLLGSFAIGAWVGAGFVSRWQRVRTTGRGGDRTGRKEGSAPA